MFDWQKFARISPHWAGITQHHCEIDSTNMEAMRLITDGLRETHVVLADHQSAGKGRRGKTWDSDKGSGLLFSLTIPLQQETQTSQLALIAGLSVLRAIKKHQLTAQIKWPNDVIYQDKKCAGILVETQQQMAVTGIGINTGTNNSATTPSSLPETASALPVEKEAFLADVLDCLTAAIAQSQQDFPTLREELRAACFLTGKNISFTQGNTTHEGKVHGIADNGALLIDTGNGPQPFHQAADIICEK